MDGKLIMRYPVVHSAFLWVFGISLAFTLQGWKPLSAVIGCFVIIVFILSRIGNVSLKRMIFYFCVLLSSTVYASTYDLLNVSRLGGPSTAVTILPESEIQMKGTIISKVEVDGDRSLFVIKAHLLKTVGEEGRSYTIEEKMQIQLRLMTPAEQKSVQAWERGSTIDLKGVLRQPAAARNYGGFDYEKYLRLKHIHWMVSVKGLNEVTAASPEFWNKHTLLRWNDQLREFLGFEIERIYSNEQSGFMKSLLIGLRDDMDPQQFQQFSQIGLTHVLAISGLHVAIFIGGVMWLLRILGVTRETNLFIAMCLVPLYVLVSGASPSVVRSGLMAFIALYAARRRRLKDGLHIISVVAVLMLLWSPYYLLDVSFQLSFLVTLGLIAGVPRFQQLLPAWPAWIKSSVSVTTVAQFVSFPLSIFYFNQFSLLSWVANLVLVPLISLIVLPLGYISLFVGMLYKQAGGALAWLIEKINLFYFWIIEWLNEYRGFQMIWPSPSRLWIVLYYMLLVILLMACIRKKHPQVLPWGMTPHIEPASNTKSAIAIALSGCVLVVLLGFGYAPNAFDRYGEVHFLDIGQGDSIFIRTPSHKTILIDGGGTMSFRKAGEEWKNRKDPYEVGKKLLVPLLKKRGVHSIDYIIISHGDTDHIGGLQAVLEQIPVEQVIFNGTLKNSVLAKQLFQTALDKNIALRTAQQGEEIRVDTHTVIQFVYPLQIDDGEIRMEKDQNEFSLVFLLQMFKSTFLFTGDMDSSVEHEWIGRTAAASITASAASVSTSAAAQKSIDVLKVAHHGSKTSTSAEWLEYWNPKLAVISVGQFNTYGHPNPAVVGRLSERGIGIFRTDVNGEIQFKVDKDSLEVRNKLQ